MDEIERRAERILAALPSYIWESDSPPVPIEEIADSFFGLYVRDVEPAQMREAPGLPELADDEEISGLLIPSLGEIWVNEEEGGTWPTRRRFTIAHEVGHYVLHRTGQQALFCRKASVQEEEIKSPTTRAPLPVTEQEANAFAAAVLMPAELVRQHYERCRGDFAELCSTFASSGAAMGRRLHAVI